MGKQPLVSTQEERGEHDPNEGALRFPTLVALLHFTGQTATRLIQRYEQIVLAPLSVLIMTAPYCNGMNCDRSRRASWLRLKQCPTLRLDTNLVECLMD